MCSPSGLFCYTHYKAFGKSCQGLIINVKYIKVVAEGFTEDSIGMKKYFQYKLTFLHKLIGICLLVLGIVFFLSPEAYDKKVDYYQSDSGVDYLQKGEYVVDIYYIAAEEDNAIIFYSPEMLNENNELGKEFLRVDVGTTGGNYKGQLFLDENVHDLNIKTLQDDETEFYVKNVFIHSVGLESRDNYLLAAVCLFGSLMTFFLGLCVPTKKYIEPLLVLGMVVIAGIPLYTDFVTTGHDLEFHVGRLEALAQGLLAGEFPVYMGSTEMAGYGTISASMYPQLFLYPFAALRMLNVSLMMAYKVMIFAINAISAFTAYYAAKRMFKSTKLAFWTSLLYTFSIYRLENVYLRAAIGESFAMAFLPLVIWGIYEVLWGDEKKWYILALGVGSVLQSHVLSTEMCALFMLIEVLVWLIGRKGNRYWKRIWAGVKAALLTVLVNAFFLVPFLILCQENLQCFNMPNVISDTGVYLSQLFNLYADYNGWAVSLGSTLTEMPLTVGTILLIGAGLLCFALVKDKNMGEEAKIAKRCMLYGMLAVYMASYLFPWDFFQDISWLKNIVTSIQFAWRFLGPASVLLCFAAPVGIVSFAKSHDSRKWIYGVCFVLLISSTSYFFSQKGIDPEKFKQYNDKMEFPVVGDTDAMYMYFEGDRFTALNMDYTWDKAKILSQMSLPFKVENLERKGMHMKMTVTGSQEMDDKLMFPLYYYPGYVAYIDGEEVPVESLKRRVSCPMPKGTAEVEVYYEGVPAAKYANWVTVLTVIGIAGYGVYAAVRKRKSKEEIVAEAVAVEQVCETEAADKE